MDWPDVRISVIIWIVILGAGLFYELLTVLDRDPFTIPLTGVVTHSVPGVITIGFLGWLFVHFLVRYIESGFWSW